MVIITRDAWATNKEGEDKDVESALPNVEYFGLQDLASDYFQVLRAASRPRVCRLLWFVLTLGLFSLTIFMVYKLLNDYFQYNSFNKISVKWQNSLELPAFTICSTNSINYTRLEEDFKEYAPELLEVIKSYLIKTELFKGESNIEEYFDETEFEAFFEFDNGSFSLKDAYGNLVYDLILSDWYMVGGKKKVFDFYDMNSFLEYTELGQCLKFNDNKSMVQKIRGSGGGFSIDLFANINTYMMTTRTRGFIIFLRDHGETVLLNQGGYVIEPGTETFLRLQKRSVTRLGKPHGTCLNIQSNLTKMEHFRSIRECVQDKSIEAMLHGCACMPSYYANTLFKLGRFDILDANVEIIQEARKNFTTVKRRKREGGAAETSSNGSGDKIPDKDGENPNNEDVIPDKDGENPNNEDVIPTQEDENPNNEAETPSKDGENPNNEDVIPDNNGENPNNEDEIPTKEDENPNNEAETPSKDGENPNNEDVIPDNNGENPNNEDEIPTQEDENPNNENVIPDNNGENLNNEDEYPTHLNEEPTESIYSSAYQQYICTFSQETVCKFMMEDYQNEIAKTYQCPEPCSFNEWDANVGVTSFPPSEKYFNEFLKDLYYYDDLEFTYSVARENLARLHIYYDDIKTTEVVQEKAYEIQNFIAEFGGTVDLFIGFSFFTVFQLIEIGIAWCCWKMMKRNKDNRRLSLPSYNGDDKDIVLYNMNE